MSFHRYQPSPTQETSSMLAVACVRAVISLGNVRNLRGFQGLQASDKEGTH